MTRWGSPPDLVGEYRLPERREEETSAKAAAKALFRAWAEIQKGRRLSHGQLEKYFSKNRPEDGGPPDQPR